MKFEELKARLLETSKFIDQEQRSGRRKQGVSEVAQDHGREEYDEDWDGYEYDYTHDCYINALSYDNGDNIDAVAKGKGNTKGNGKSTGGKGGKGGRSNEMIYRTF